MAGRITQVPVLVAGEPSTRKGRLTQIPVLVAGEPSTRKARVTQIVVLCVGESAAGGRNHGFWGRGVVGIAGGGSNAGAFGD